MTKKIKHIKQSSLTDCGPTCLAMVLNYYGANISVSDIHNAAKQGIEGVNLLGLANAAEKYYLKSLSVEIFLEILIKDAPLPCKVHWNQNHFVVATPNSTLKKIEIADPAHGIIKYTRKEFCKH